MANHVFSHISFENLSEEGKNFLLDNTDRTIDNYEERFLSAVYSSYPEEYDYDWHVENIGAKWITIEDIDEEYVNVTTAWSSPTPFYEALYEKLASLNSPDLMMWVQYDDEMPNFVGVWGRAPGDYDYEECLEEEFYKQAIGSTPGVETLDEETEEYNWESNDNWYEELQAWYDSEYDAFKQEYQEYHEG